MDAMMNASLAPPSSSLTVSFKAYLPAEEYRWICESVAVNGNVPPGLGYGSGAVPSLK
jgi:hypothetical protein